MPATAPAASGSALEEKLRHAELDQRAHAFSSIYAKCLKVPDAGSQLSDEATRMDAYQVRLDLSTQCLASDVQMLTQYTESKAAELAAAADELDRRSQYFAQLTKAHERWDQIFEIQRHVAELPATADSLREIEAIQQQLSETCELELTFERRIADFKLNFISVMNGLSRMKAMESAFSHHQ